MYSEALASPRILLMTMLCSARLARRFPPPLLSLCLTVLPLDASIGLAPHSMANDASDRMRPGLSPAARPSSAALRAPRPSISSTTGAFSRTIASTRASSSEAFDSASIQVAARVDSDSISESRIASPVAGFLRTQRVHELFAAEFGSDRVGKVGVSKAR